MDVLSWVKGFLGGLAIGLGAAILLLGSGQIMGFSGIISSVLKNPVAAAQDASQQWKLTFLTAFMLSAYIFLFPAYDADIVESHPSVNSVLAHVVSGLFVGFGTKLGNGCTSGHGICGMARFSQRSIVSVGTFMAVAVATATITSPELDIGKNFDFLRTDDLEFDLPFVMPVVTSLLVAATVYGAVTIKEMSNEESRQRIPAALAGVIASGGLTLSQMVYPKVVHGFLDLSALGRGDWDPTLMFVMAGGVTVSFVAYQFVPGHGVVTSCPKLETPLVGGKYGVPTNTLIDWQLVLGALLFGTGWGVSGLCPGPALLLTMRGLSGMILLWWPTFYIGNRLAEFVKERFPVSRPAAATPCDCDKSEPTDHPTHEMKNDGGNSDDSLPWGDFEQPSSL